MKNSAWWFIGLGGMLMVTAGCAEETGTDADGQNGGEAEVETEVDVEGDEEVVNIGYTGPLSGPAAYYGENTLNGMRMAAEEINEEGFEIDGVTYKVNVIAYDDMYLPNEAGTNARRLVQENDTAVVFVPHSGGVFATQVFNEEEEFLIAAYTSEPDVLEQGNELTLRIPPAYTMYPDFFIDYQMENFGERLALLPTATQYGKDWTETIVPEWEEAGGEIVFDGEIDFSQDTDFYNIVSNALNSDPDVLFVGGASEPTALVIDQAKELGFEGGFMVMDQAKLEEMEAVLGGYERLEGAVGVLPQLKSDAAGAEAFNTGYQEQYDRIPTSESAFNYQAMYVLVEAMKASGSVDDAQAIMAAMDEGVKALDEEDIVWYLEGVEDQGFDWLGGAAAVENGEIVVLEE
ncbi:ABC transporter substrate-binding protein [Bacillus sp. FJAT-44742]|uniref:ABC transporter substrate-binding protein n=1 Tax=Bacillus sp. FJAT-44742 TaxID=2014005 RepID=UPI001E6286D9|nr:ABC transporter substrate-binding protein [Bacillus sp. FJAT-44742]